MSTTNEFATERFIKSQGPTRQFHFVSQEPAFVGRDYELEVLSSALFRAKTEIRYCCVHGSSGTGKSRLLKEFSKRARQTNARIFNCETGPIGMRPLHSLAGLVCRILEIAMLDEQFAEELKKKVGTCGPTLAKILPDLAPILADEIESSEPESFGQQRTIEALIVLFRALGSPDRPAVILIDDCQWADFPTVQLIKAWQQSVNTPGHTLVVTAFRDEVEGKSGGLFFSDTVIGLPPLDEFQIHGFLSPILGPVTSEVANLVYRLSSGHPYLAQSLVRTLVNRNIIVRRGSQWVVDLGPLKEAELSSRLAAPLQDQLSRLSKDALELLMLASILGRHFDLIVLEHLFRKSAEEIVLLTSEAIYSSLVSIDSNGNYKFVHDMVRENLESMIPDHKKIHLHKASAEAMVKLRKEKIFDIAYHFDRAGEFDRALPYALQAAKEARAQFDLESSQRHFEIALKASGNESTLFEILRDLAEVRMLRGHYEEAKVLLNEASEKTNNVLQQAQVESLFGRLLFKLGCVVEAENRFLNALKLLGDRISTTGRGRYFAIVKEIAVCLLNSLLNNFFPKMRLNGDADLVRVASLQGLAMTGWFGGGIPKAALYHIRAWNFLIRREESGALAQLYAHHAIAWTAMPIFRWAIDYCNFSYQAHRNLNSRWGQGYSLGLWGSVLYSCTRYKEALEKLEGAMKLLGQTGDIWEANVAFYLSGFTHYRLGNLDKACEIAHEGFLKAEQTGDIQIKCNSIVLIAKARHGDIDDKMIEKERNNPNVDRATRLQLYVALGLCRLHQKRFNEALQLLHEAVEMSQKPSLLRCEYVAATYPWLVTAYRMKLESAFDPSLLKEALAVAKKTLRMSFWFPNNYAHATREYGLLVGLRGSPKTAMKYIRKGIARAERDGAKQEVKLGQEALRKIQKRQNFDVPVKGPLV